MPPVAQVHALALAQKCDDMWHTFEQLKDALLRASHAQAFAHILRERGSCQAQQEISQVAWHSGIVRKARSQ